MSRTMPWQPMPAPTRVSSGTLVERLWGHPEQKYGERSTESGSSCFSRFGGVGGASRSAMRALSRSRRPVTIAPASRMP
jgi:hypothetical protein